MKITKDLKTTTGDFACEDGRKWFSRRFPKGATVNQAIMACPRGDWLIWGLWNFGLASIEQIIVLGCMAGRRSLRFAREQSRPALVAAFDAADAVADNNTEETRRAARSAAWSAAWRAARSADRRAEHKAICDAMRAMMRTKQYKSKALAASGAAKEGR